MEEVTHFRYFLDDGVVGYPYLLVAEVSPTLLALDMYICELHLEIPWISLKFILISFPKQKPLYSLAGLDSLDFACNEE